MEDCLFCKIASGDGKAEKLYEDGKTLAFLDIFPASQGHSLVIPKKHYRTLTDMSPGDLAATIKTVQKIGKAVAKAMNAGGFNVVQSNERAAGQVVFHVHFHVIPRKEGDKLSFSWPHLREKDIDLPKSREMIKKYIQ